MSTTLQTPLPIVGATRGDDFVDTFANQIRLSANLGEITLVFGVIDDLGPGHLMNKDKVAVRLSMPSAKMLMMNMRTAIESYEAAVSVIPLAAGAEDGQRAMKEAMENSFRHMLNLPSPPVGHRSSKP